MMIPQNLLPRKALLDRLFLPALVVLIGLGAFGLGRLSALGQGSQCSAAAAQE